MDLCWQSNWLSLLFNMLSRLVIAFLPRSKPLKISTARKPGLRTEMVWWRLTIWIIPKDSVACSEVSRTAVCLQVQTPPLPITRWATLGKLLTLSVPWFLHLWDKNGNPCYFTKLLWGLSKHRKSLGLSSINVGYFLCWATFSAETTSLSVNSHSRCQVHTTAPTVQMQSLRLWGIKWLAGVCSASQWADGSPLKAVIPLNSSMIQNGPSAAAAAKSLQSCLTLCDPIDSSPPSSPIPGVLQARTLKWVAISFSNAWKWKVKVKSLSRVRLLATPWTAAYQAPPSMGFSRQEYCSGVPLPSLNGPAVPPKFVSLFSHRLPGWTPPQPSLSLPLLVSSYLREYPVQGKGARAGVLNLKLI